MAHSFTNLLCHIVFATKGREPWIDDGLRPKLMAYIEGILRKKNCVPVVVNAMPEHVHIFARAHPLVAPADLVRTVKAGASGWVHRTRADLAHFGWQTGYGGFAVSQAMFETVRQYVVNQHEHHRTTSYTDELRRMVREEGLDVTDERLLWE